MEFTLLVATVSDASLAQVADFLLWLFNMKEWASFTIKGCWAMVSNTFHHLGLCMIKERFFWPPDQPVSCMASVLSTVYLLEPLVGAHLPEYIPHRLVCASYVEDLFCGYSHFSHSSLGNSGFFHRPYLFSVLGRWLHLPPYLPRLQIYFKNFTSGRRSKSCFYLCGRSRLT